eukprot:CAMPEP_0202970244 /NCGR_PEP_ID=MMETSP1396-20130829/16235_1 /ASSEMBLY_ACC=CAM_ASM_000872 /TAXON_ID= /ORGANISM="Pseudokeronopsis sp., Strain Brazil" /LENGTH=38 /DNA_ID= /DNA_START= /DNA_END= /DNA_ORIENTATION=
MEDQLKNITVYVFPKMRYMIMLEAAYINLRSTKMLRAR